MKKITLNKQNGFIQIPLLIALIASILAVSGAGYFGVKQYQSYKADKAEKALEEKTAQDAQKQKDLEDEKLKQEAQDRKDLEVETLKKEVEALKNKKPEAINTPSSTSTKLQTFDEWKKNKGFDTSTSSTGLQTVEEWKKSQGIISETPNNASSITDFAKFIVRVICTNGDRNNLIVSSGSGTIFGLNHFIITNSHVVEGAALCSIGLTDDIKLPPSRWYEATVASNITSLDIAMLKPSDPLPSDVSTIAYNLCSPDDISLGDPVMVIGYPSVGGNTITATEGVISGFDGYMVKTSAKIEHGNSGGGAFLKNKNCWFGIPTSVQQGSLESLGYIINYSLIHQQSN